MASSMSSKKRFQFSLLSLLLLTTALGPLLGWYGPVIAENVRDWLAKDDSVPWKLVTLPSPPQPAPIQAPARTARLVGWAPKTPGGVFGSEQMIGPISVDVERGMQIDALQRGSSRSR